MLMQKEHYGVLWYFLEWSILHKILSLIHLLLIMHVLLANQNRGNILNE